MPDNNGNNDSDNYCDNDRDNKNHTWLAHAFWTTWLAKNIWSHSDGGMHSLGSLSLVLNISIRKRICIIINTSITI